MIYLKEQDQIRMKYKWGKTVSSKSLIGALHYTVMLLCLQCSQEVFMPLLIFVLLCYVGL